MDVYDHNNNILNLNKKFLEIENKNVNEEPINKEKLEIINKEKIYNIPNNPKNKYNKNKSHSFEDRSLKYKF
jgi:hypothetical protein